MRCPSCVAEMEALRLESLAVAAVEIDLCSPCQAFWFDRLESLQLASGSILQLFTRIGETAVLPKRQISSLLKCPRCQSHLNVTHDQQRNTPFQYWHCPHDHGRFITFFQFLREKDFIRPLSKEQLAELRRNLRSVNCSNCGGSIDISWESACAHCGTALSILDVEQMARAVDELKRASEPRKIDPALPLEIARARREVEAAFQSSAEWSRPSPSGGLVEAGLTALLNLLKNSKD